MWSYIILNVGLVGICLGTFLTVDEPENYTPSHNQGSDPDVNEYNPYKVEGAKENQLRTLKSSFLTFEEDVLVVVTLDGTLTALGKRTGRVKWILKDEPLVKVPQEQNRALGPVFLPDPKDGSLYLFGAHGKNPLKKLPFSVPDLVKTSPCKSSDGVLYTGKKSDTWIMVNPVTGSKESVVTAGDSSECPIVKDSTLILGKTEYTLLIWNSRTQEKWNVTYSHYSSYPIKKPLSYDLSHFTSSSSGEVLTVDRATGSIMWEEEFSSPVVGIYHLNSAGLLSLPFTSVSRQTLFTLADRFSASSLRDRLSAIDTMLMPSLYIGEHKHGLYALSSLVDENTPRITPSSVGPLLLEGPDGESPAGIEVNVPIDINIENMLPFSEERRKLVIIYGFYQAPEQFPYTMSPAFQITHQDDDAKIIQPMPDNPYVPGTVKFQEMNKTLSFGRFILSWLLHTSEQEGLIWKSSVIVILTFILSTIFVMYRKVNDITSRGNHYSNMSNSSNDSDCTYQITAKAENLGDGNVRVGKITFNVLNPLGKGCEGTFVYRGKFDHRDVAVKRMLPDCFSFADREVNLLRESDEHSHVIRYFCMEQDEQFRYIALELCQYTLQEYIENNIDASVLSPVSILQQATSGLVHLHSLDIVHRDIKPQNVLISMPNSRGEVKAMISDFGLCKKLKMGRMSYSRSSGSTGTEGYMAPEIILGNNRATPRVDIFSLGCVFYYVLTKGSHPFGDAIHVQANIVSERVDLSGVENSVLFKALIDKMLSQNPLQRPPASAIVDFPVFWKQDRVLRFFQDVSDRVEIEDSESVVLRALERNALEVTGGDWKLSLDEHVSSNLRKYRSYKGWCVRDLLRALRNKLHHYRELSDAAKLTFGRIPDEFADYWLSRFPKLLLQSWIAMQIVKNEPIFQRYYDNSYEFVQVRKENDTYFAPSYGAAYSNKDKVSMEGVEPKFFPKPLSPKKGAKKKKSKSPVTVPWIMNKEEPVNCWTEIIPEHQSEPD